MTTQAVYDSITAALASLAAADRVKLQQDVLCLIGMLERGGLKPTGGVFVVPRFRDRRSPLRAAFVKLNRLLA